MKYKKLSSIYLSPGYCEICCMPTVRGHKRCQKCLARICHYCTEPATHQDGSNIPVCEHHLRENQTIEYAGHQRRQWADEHPDDPAMPDHMKSKGLQEVEQDARFERQELMEIACPWIAIRKRSERQH